MKTGKVANKRQGALERSEAIKYSVRIEKKAPDYAFNDTSSLQQRRGSSCCRRMFLTLPNKYQRLVHVEAT